MNYDQLIGGSGQASALRLTALVRATRSFTIPAWARRAYCVFHGAGGSGAWGGNGTSATGGNSAPWGVVTIDVAPTKVLTFNFGAPGAKPAISSNGIAGADSTLVYDGSTVMTVGGGEGGIYAAGGGNTAPANPVATVTGADFWVSGLPAFNASNGASGGGAANIYNMTLAEVATTVAQRGRSVGTNDTTGLPLLGLIHQSIPVMFFSTTAGHPGVGNDSATPVAGLFAGGFGYDSSGAATASHGGQGGGGGGGLRNSTTTGITNTGGAALAYVVISE